MQRDDALLFDMLTHARLARRHVAAMTWEQFEVSALHQGAVIHALEVLGEAARNVSQAFADAHPEIPWRQMIGMRNALAHEYFRVDVRRIWETVQNDLPAVMAAVEKLLPPLDE